MRLKLTIIVLFTGLFVLNAKGQTIPVGTPLLIEEMRNAQLLGKVDSAISFSVMPIFPLKTFKSGDQNDFYKALDNENWKNNNPTFHFLNKP